jgi:hypothetical protein
MEHTTNRQGIGADPTKGGGNVVSIAAARHRRPRSVRRNARNVTADGLDLEGLDVDRMSSGARELYWFNVNRHARRLFLASSDASIMSARNPYAEITADHVQRAEEWRRRSERRGTRQFGLTLVLDALQICGAATCGALATRPAFIADAGIYPLAAALMLTATLFLLREWIAATE